MNLKGLWIHMYYSLISFTVESDPFVGLALFQIKWSNRSMALIATKYQVVSLPNAVVHSCVYDGE